MLSKFAATLDDLRRAYERNAQRYHYHPDYTPSTAFTWVNNPLAIGSQDNARALAHAIVGPYAPPPQTESGSPQNEYAARQEHTRALLKLENLFRPGAPGAAVPLSAFNHPAYDGRYNTQLEFDPARDHGVNAAAQHFQQQMRDRLDEHNRLHGLSGSGARHPRFYDFFVSDKPHATVPSALGLPDIQSAAAQEAFDKLVALHETNELTAERRGEGASAAYPSSTRARRDSARMYGHHGTRPWLGDFNIVNRLVPQQGLTSGDINHLRHVVLGMRKDEVGDLLQNQMPHAVAATSALMRRGRVSRHVIDSMNQLRALGLA